jgi:hypothetical protein
MPKKTKRGEVLTITDGSTAAKVRLSAKEVALARKQAEERGIPCLEYLKSTLEEKLRKPDAGVKAPTS